MSLTLETRASKKAAAIPERLKRRRTKLRAKSGQKPGSRRAGRGVVGHLEQQSMQQRLTITQRVTVDHIRTEKSSMPAQTTNHADVLAPAELARINKRLWELDSLAVDRGSLTAAEQAEYDELDARLERHLAAVAPWPKKELDAERVNDFETGGVCFLTKVIR